MEISPGFAKLALNFPTLDEMQIRPRRQVVNIKRTYSGRQIMDKEIIAAVMAASSDLNLMTLDRIEACTKGHGSLNMAVLGIANVVAEELQRGADIAVKFADSIEIPIDHVLSRAIAAAKEAGADAANAALLSATTLLMAGSNAQAGVPAGSRKLGGMARILAGADRCGVAALPSIKRGNKVSGFAAVEAIYRALAEGKLTRIQGSRMPRGLGPVFGHGALGEEIVIPELAANAAKVGTTAMLNAMSGAGIDPDPLSAALLGSAAALEIVHPDAWIPNEEGEFHRGAAYPVGKAASEAAGLPKKLHVYGTDEEYDTARLVGDVGLILKDVGGDSLIGMVALQDILNIFKEAPFMLTQAARSNAHHSEDAILALKTLQWCKFDFDRAVEIFSRRGEHSMDPETTMVCVNTVARKAEQVRRGPITRMMIAASEPIRTKALYDRAERAGRELAAGTPLASVVEGLDRDRQAVVERRTSQMMSNAMGKEISIRMVKAYSRNTKDKLSRWWGLDGDADMEVGIDGKTVLLERVISEVAVKVAETDDPELRELLFIAGRPLRELLLGGNIILNVTIPTAIAVMRGMGSAKELAQVAEKAAYITAGIPGARQKAAEVARLAERIVRMLDSTNS
jgi:hypothetical protein